MSLTLATVADALIEFILSLLKDPEVRAEFEDDPDAALAQRGLSHVSPADVHAVTPVIIERTQVVQQQVPVFVRQATQPQPEQHHSSNPVVREIQQVSQNFSWVDDRDTIVDQSVNQNIWAKGDVTQTFDNDAVVASGDEAIAGGGAVDVDKTYDHSTNISADDDVNIGNDTDVTVIDDSFDEDTDTTTTTDESTDLDIDGSGNDDSTDVDISDSLNEQVDESTTTDVDAAVTVVGDATDVLIDGPGASSETAAPIEQVSAEDAPAEQAVEAPAEPTDAGYADSAVEYTEIESDIDGDDSAFGSNDTVIEESATDDNF